MNRTLWKLDHIGERLWNLATISATQSAVLGSDGRGIAVVAEETRKMADKVNSVVEKAMTEGADIDKDEFTSLAFQLNFLALNSAIESSRLGERGKQAAVCAEGIRQLAYQIVCLFDKELSEKFRHPVVPWPKNPMTTPSQNGEFILLNIGGIPFVETLANVKEVCGPMVGHRDGHIVLRSMELPLVDGYKMLGKPQETPTYAIVWTPWAEQNKTYAVAADISCLFFSPIGKPVDVPPDMPLAKYVRECWENENGEPFYFMDWTKMV